MFILFFLILMKHIMDENKRCANGKHLNQRVMKKFFRVCGLRKGWTYIVCVGSI